ncbi:hypothetical protein [Rhizobium sp. BK176]|uniref:hypothetical protein n=1 Tax=Rhizobium sp. BK176 TaxID=2587071 RepID=UPI0021685740|nr:hypothetical protein [Rhizobium sp. BK176]MCS4089286.1 hypothetical protein [Rhizobium sp. BK176]
MSAEPRLSVCKVLGLDPAIAVIDAQLAPREEVVSAAPDQPSVAQRAPTKKSRWDSIVAEVKDCCIKAILPTALFFGAYVAAALMYENAPNANVVVSLDRTCRDTDANEMTDNVSKALAGSRVLASSIRPGTSTCAIVFQVATDVTESDLLAQLAAAGMSGHLEDYKLRNHPLG